MRLPSPPLLLVTDRHQARNTLPNIAAEACAGGCRWISVREKDLPETEQVALFADLRPTLPASARAVVHGSVAVAKTANADGVHLAVGGDPVAARNVLGARALIGLSVHSAADVKDLPDALDYVIAGPVFETQSKTGYGPALGAAGLAAIAAASKVPVIAIGGISSARVAEVVRAGAAGVAVMGAVMRAADPRREIALLCDALAACGIPVV